MRVQMGYNADEEEHWVKQSGKKRRRRKEKEVKIQLGCNREKKKSANVGKMKKIST